MPHYTMAPELTDNYINTVWETLSQHVRPTLLLQNPALSDQLRCELTIASETFQYTGSFKFRAAYNLLSSIPHRQVIAASSGNFGQAVAFASKLLGKQCIVTMPKTSARVKVEAVRSYGGIVDLIDVQEVSRFERIDQLLAEHPAPVIAPAFDDYRVVAGNSTFDKDIFDVADFDVLV